MPLALIFLLYLIVGLLAAGGSIALTSKHFTSRGQQIAYGVLLTPIAAIYLAFLAHLSPSTPWRAELVSAAAFSLLGLMGTRLTPILMLAYLGHGAWDLLHEVLMHQGRLGKFTPIPLAYGVFCAAFDWLLVGYFWTRRSDWARSWEAA